MWTQGWRDKIWTDLDQPWDLIVIGGGISGAGVLHEAVRFGLRTLLVEANDFASGTSSRSSKLVHGGFRYLRHAKLRLTYESVQERELLLRQGRGLVNPLAFLLASYQGDSMPPWLYGLGLILYDLLGRKWNHRHYDARDLLGLSNQLNPQGLLGGYRYFDAQTDDARLVLRLIREAVQQGGVALNYARVNTLLRQKNGRVCGVVLEDQVDGRSAEVQAPVVINATGAWADELRQAVGGRGRLRPLRGSHLIFPMARLPLSRAVSLFHPRDHRPVFALPWEGVTLIGTTDVDHQRPLVTDPSISESEADYLLSAAQHMFPALDLTFDDVQATFAGVRPVVNTGKADPSKEPREHVLWREQGLITLTGGKLTTFRIMAHDALRRARGRLRTWSPFNRGGSVLDSRVQNIDLPGYLPAATGLRLLGRYGLETPDLLQLASRHELQSIADAPALWAELRWAAHAEGVIHLDDLLLRRVRIGLLLPEGGLPWIDPIRTICQSELGWDDRRWDAELAAYRLLWARAYSPPGAGDAFDPARGRANSQRAA